MTQKILVTGANGAIGSMLRQSLRRPGRHLRLLDVVRQADVQPGEDAEVIEGSFLDAATIESACRDVEAIVHLGGLSSAGYTWPEYLDVNIHGTYLVLEAARKAGVSRVIYASSNHAVGYQPLSPDGPVPDRLFARPDTFYGVSKAASESLASLYHDRHGLDVICLRIGSYRDRPFDVRSLWSWLSPGDCTRLVEAALSTPSPGFRVVWGVSANSRAAVSLEEGYAIGYFPLDDAGAFADEVTPDEGDGPDVRGLIGGAYTAKTFE